MAIPNARIIQHKYTPSRSAMNTSLNSEKLNRFANWRGHFKSLILMEITVNESILYDTFIEIIIWC